MTHSDADRPDRPRPVLSDGLRSELEGRLLEERERSQDSLDAALEDERRASDDGTVSSFPSHPADAASRTDEEDLDARVAERSSDRITAIDEALVRLREHPERYGACEICGATIDLERLQMIPWARRCGEHARSQAAAVERNG